MCEALITLAATIGLGSFLGALGVAAGLVTGAVSGVVLTLLWSHPMTNVVALSGRTIAAQSALKPLLAILVAECVFFVLGAQPSSEGVRISAAAAMALVSGAVLWFWCVPATFHAMARSMMLKLTRHPIRRPAVRH